MGILDEAIKEHLELKRQHGAGESELKKLEDEAFGAAERPGDESSEAASEAPTAFMAQPDLPKDDAAPGEDAGARRRPDPQIAGLQEPPEPESAEPETAAPPEPEAPAEEQETAMEHEAVAAPEPEAEPVESASHSTEERQAIAEHPTEMYDVEGELQEGEAAEVEVTDAREEPAASDEGDDLDDDFWDEKRLSDELDQALEAPDEPAAEVEPEPVEVKPEEEGEPGPVAEERDEDVLEETPDFLEEAPEDDRLWFEQKPPKDFDFDD